MALLKPVYETTVVEVVVPVYNEAANLEMSIRRLDTFLDLDFPFPALITIVDNGSSDVTWAIAERLCGDLGRVHAIHLVTRNRGRALRTAWMTSEADVLAGMDVDVAADPGALLPLVAPLLSGHSDIAVARRLLPEADHARDARPDIISRRYNRLIRLVLGAPLGDANSGLMAIRAECWCSGLGFASTKSPSSGRRTPTPSA